MAVIAVNVVPNGGMSDAAVRYLVASWSPLAAGDTGAPVSLSDYADRSVQVTGTFNGSTVTIQGTNNGIDWNTLNDALGNPLTFTTAGLKSVLENVAQIRPSVAGGTAIALSVNLLVR